MKSKTKGYILLLIMILVATASFGMDAYLSEFGNLTDTTVWIGGTEGIVNATGRGIFSTVDTGNGATEIYDMNQDIRSDDAVTFLTLNTGNGALELYDILGDLAVTSPLNGGVNNIFYGTDGTKATISIPVATTSADGYLSQTDWDTFDGKADTDTTYSDGNGISEVATIFSVAGNTALTQDADGLSVTADAIGDTQLEYNTGQHLTSTSDVTFQNVTVGDMVLMHDGLHSDGTPAFIVTS